VGPDKKGVTRMIYKPEHVVDLETGAIVDVDLKPGDEPDAEGLTDRVRQVEENLNAALSEPRRVARIATVVGDMGYCAVDALVELQTAGVRTAIPDPVKNRRLDKLPPEQRQALQTAKRTCRSASGRWLMQHRGEFAERSFVHVLDYGGARRTTLRGRENILKRYVVQAACLNLSILLRKTLCIGTVKQAWAASGAATEAFILIFDLWPSVASRYLHTWLRTLALRVTLPFRPAPIAITLMTPTSTVC
jgi:transposase